LHPLLRSFHLLSYGLCLFLRHFSRNLSLLSRKVCFFHCLRRDGIPDSFVRNVLGQGKTCCYSVSRWNRLFDYRNSRYSVLPFRVKSTIGGLPLCSSIEYQKKHILFDLLKFFLAKPSAAWQNHNIPAC